MSNKIQYKQLTSIGKLQQPKLRRLSNLFALALIALVLFTSCGKGASSNNPEPSISDGTIQYKVNGALVTSHDQGINSNKQVNFVKQNEGLFASLMVYMLRAKSSNDSLELRIYTDSLTTKNYLYDAVTTNSLGYYPLSLSHNGQVSTVIFEGDYLNITITSYANGFISGKFDGKLTPYRTGSTSGAVAFPDEQGTVVITEGQFKNIPCFYK